MKVPAWQSDFSIRKGGKSPPHVRFLAYLASWPVGLFPLRHGKKPIATREPDYQSCDHYEMAQGSIEVFRCLLVRLDN